MSAQAGRISEVLDLELIQRLVNHVQKSVSIPARLQSSRSVLVASPAQGALWPSTIQHFAPTSSRHTQHPLYPEVHRIGCLNQAWLPLTVQAEEIAALVLGEFLFVDQVTSEADVLELARLSEISVATCRDLLNRTPRIPAKTYQSLVEHCRLQLDCISSTANHFLKVHPVAAAQPPQDGPPEIPDQLQTLFEGEQDGILVQTPDGRILDASDSACRIYGYTLEELRQIHTKDLIPPGLELVHFEGAKAPKRTLETLRLRKDGVTIPVELSGHYWKLNDQPLVIIVVRDISSRKKADEQTRLTLERIDLALEVSEAGLWDWNIRTSSLYLSTAWFEKLGYPAALIPQTHDAWQRLIHPDDLSRVNSLTGQHFTGQRRGLDAEFRVRDQQDGWRWISSRGRVVESDPDGRPVRAIGTFVDITSRKATEFAWRSSEQKFYKSFQTSPDAISISRKRDAVYIDVNDGFCMMSGYRHEEIIGHSSSEINIWLHPEERRKMVADLQINGEVIGMEASFRRKDGSVIIALLSTRLVEIDREPCVLSIARDITERKHAEDQLRAAHLRLEWAYEATLLGWNRALEMRDVATRRHSDRCIDLTLQLAQAAGIQGDELTFVKYGAILHDIGKMAIPDSILNKPAKLSRDEWALMRNHPLYAQELLQGIEYLHPALPLIANHHERWDGNGYPLGLSGEEIPLTARIFAIVDVWDSIIHPRVWRPALGEAAARQYLLENSGLHFDPHLIELFWSIVGK